MTGLSGRGTGQSLNKGTLPIVARLKALQDPSHIAPGGGRVIAGLHDASPLTALLREANETIMARSLRFESGNGTSVTLDVAGRRFLRLAEAQGVGGAEACIAAPALEDDLKDDLIKVLQAVAAPRSELRVTSLPMTRETEGMSVGLPVALVADLLLIELNDSPEAAAPAPEPLREARRPRPVAVSVVPDPAPEPAPEVSSPPAGLLGRLAQGMGPALMAWLIVGSEEDGLTEGPEEMVSHLKGFLADEGEAVLRQLDLVSNHPGAPTCLVLGATLVEGHSVLCARAGDAILLGVIEGDGTQTLLQAWAEGLD